MMSEKEVWLAGWYLLPRAHQTCGSNDVQRLAGLVR